jgi:hypothetical protein
MQSRRTADPRHASCEAGAAPRVAVRSLLTFDCSRTVGLEAGEGG